MKSPGIRLLSQAGDTIVEVLICMAITSLVLGGAFVATRDSQLGVRNSQEHAEALKLLESQVEQLRTAASTGASSNVFQSGTFCMVAGGRVSIPSGECTQTSDGSPAGSTQPAYSLAIACTSGCDATNGFLFKAQVTWAQVTGSGTGDEVMYYRLYE